MDSYTAQRKFLAFAAHKERRFTNHFALGKTECFQCVILHADEVMPFVAHYILNITI